MDEAQEYFAWKTDLEKRFPGDFPAMPEPGPESPPATATPAPTLTPASALPAQDEYGAWKSNFINKFPGDFPDAIPPSPAPAVAPTAAGPSLPPEPVAEVAPGPTPGGAGWGEQRIPSAIAPLPGKKMGTAERLSRHFVSGALGTAEGMGGALQWITGGAMGKDFSDYMAGLRKDVTPEGEASFAEQLASGAGSMATFFIPGFGVARGLSLAARVAPKAASWLGAGTMAITEAATEAGQVYRGELEKGKDPERAGSAASWTFWLNLPVLTLTDKLAFFGNQGKTLSRALRGMVTEGSQESLQEVISTWSQEEQQNLKNILTSGAVGALLGGGVGAIAKPPGARETVTEPGTEATIEPISGPLPAEITGVPFDFVGRERAMEALQPSPAGEWIEPGQERAQEALQRAYGIEGGRERALQAMGGLVLPHGTRAEAPPAAVVEPGVIPPAIAPPSAKVPSEVAPRTPTGPMGVSGTETQVAATAALGIRRAPPEPRGIPEVAKPPETPAPPVTTSGDAAQTLGARKPPTPTITPTEIAPPAAAGEVISEAKAPVEAVGAIPQVTPEVEAFMGKYGTARGVGAPDVGLDKSLDEIDDRRKILKEFGKFDSRADILKNFEPSERKLLFPYTKRGAQGPDELLAEVKGIYPHLFGEFETDADLLRAIIDGKLKPTNYAKIEEAHYAAIEREAAENRLDATALAKAEADVAREIAAERDAIQNEPRLGEPIDLEAGWPTTEEPPALRAGAPKPTALETRLDALEADYPGIDRERAATVIRALPNAEDGQVVNMAADQEMFAQVARGNLAASEKAQLLKKATDAGAQQGLPGMEGARGETLFKVGEEAALARGLTTDQIQSRLGKFGTVSEVGEDAMGDKYNRGWLVRLNNGQMTFIYESKAGSLELLPGGESLGPDYAALGIKSLGPNQRIAGAFKPVSFGSVIELARGEGIRTFDHESWHTIEHWLLNPKEREAIRKQFGDNEEVRAEAYANWNPKEAPNTIFQKILDFFQRIVKALTGKGKGEDVFAAARSGELFGRKAVERLPEFLAPRKAKMGWESDPAYEKLALVKALHRGELTLEGYNDRYAEKYGEWESRKWADNFPELAFMGVKMLREGGTVVSKRKYRVEEGLPVPFAPAPTLTPAPEIKYLVRNTRFAQGDPLATRFEDMAERGETAFKELRTPKLKEHWENLKRLTIDTSANIKKELLARGGDAGRKVEMMHDLMRGASAKGESIFREAEDKIYKGLSKAEEIVLNRAILARRIIEIASYKPDHTFPEMLGPREAQAYLDKIPLDVATKLMPRVDEYFAAWKANLDIAYDAGLINKESYDAMIHHEYSPFQFIQHIDPEGMGFDARGRKITVPESGIKKLKEGSDQLLNLDSRLMLAQGITRTQARIAKNEANKALRDLAKDVPESGIVRIAKRIKVDPNEVNFSFENAPPEYDMTAAPQKVIYKYEPLGNNETYIKFRENGQEKRLIMPDQFAREWVHSDPMISSQMATVLGYATGSKLLRATATGMNPGFAITNIFRDMAHIWLTTHEYSSFAPKFTLQMGKDIMEVMGDAVRRKGAYKQYINEGGGMSFLTNQGQEARLTGTLGKIQHYLGWIGETSEILTRLALRNRALKNGLNPLEATWTARNYLDFSQGGSFSKAVDSAVPYLNASIQGTRGIFRAARTDPKLFTWKVAQIGAMATGLYLANSLINPDGWDEIPENEKVTNWIITTPFSYIDEMGNKRYHYIRIAKDQGQRIFASAFEGALGLLMGKKVDGDQIASAISDFLPVVPNEKLPPALQAMLGYYSNKDFWRNKDIWQGPKVEASEEYTKYTNPVLVKAGELTGTSPERLGYALGSMVPATNTFVALVGGGIKSLVADLPEKDRQSVLETISKPITSKFLRTTDPYTPYAKDIEELSVAESTMKLKQRRGLEKLIDANIDLPAEERLQIYRDYIAQQAPEDTKRLIREAKNYEAYHDLTDRRWWLKLSHLDPEVRAEAFYRRYKNVDPDEQERLSELAKKLPGINSDRFKAKLYQLDSGLEMPEVNESALNKGLAEAMGLAAKKGRKSRKPSPYAALGF